MNERALKQVNAPSAPHLAEHPNRGYWLDELRLKDFLRLVRLAESEERLQASLESEFFTPQRLWALKKLAEAHGDTPQLKLNLLMVASFLEHRRSAAVIDVAEENLEQATLSFCTNRAGERDRLALAVLLYNKDPALLTAIDLWDRWHSHRRCVFERQGSPRLGVSLGGVDWRKLAIAALDDLGLEEVELRAVLSRRGGAEILLGFRQVGPWSNVRTEKGEVVPGRDDDWTLLLFHDGGNALDTTASDHARANRLADTLAEHLWGEGSRYVPVRRPICDADLRKLLARLTDPSDATFRLLEMVATVPQLPDRPTVTVTNTDQIDVERAIAAMRLKMPYGYEWSDVISVKMAFMGRYRILVNFPKPGEEPVLTYADVDRDKAASQAFERLLEEELGVVVKPKVPIEVRYTRRTPRKPKRLKREDYHELLKPVVDRPTDWMIETLRVLARDGLLRLRWSCVLRCGDGGTTTVSGGETLDCPGEVEMPYGAVSAELPFEQLPESAYTCGQCGRMWHPARKPLPLFLRLRVELVHEAIFSWLLQRVSSRVVLTLERPGLASGRFCKKPVSLVYLPLASEEDRSLSMAASRPVCFVGRYVPEGYHERGLDLVDVLSEGDAPVLAAWRLGASPLLLGQPAPVAQSQSLACTTAERKPEKRMFTLDERGIWFEGKPVADSRATGTRMLLALLWAAACIDDKVPVARKLRGHKQLGELAKIPLKDNLIQLWVCRLRERLLQIAPEEVDALIVRVRNKGYRLGDGVVCVGLDLEQEVKAAKARRDV